MRYRITENKNKENCTPFHLLILIDDNFIKS